MLCFEKHPLFSLGRPHGAATTKFSLSYAVNEVRRTDEQVQVEGPILAVLEGPEPVEDQGFAGRGAGPKLFVEERAVTAEAFGLALQCAVRDTELAADLAQAGPADETMKEGFQEVGVPQPIGGREGL
jgi:hypothetical protein